MIFWEDLIKASVAADKDTNELFEKVRRRENEIKAAVPSEELSGSDAQNNQRLTRACLEDEQLAELVRQYQDSRNRSADAKAELEIATLRLSERLVEAHEANMAIAERIHGS